MVVLVVGTGGAVVVVVGGEVVVVGADLFVVGVVVLVVVGGTEVVISDTLVVVGGDELVVVGSLVAVVDVDDLEQPVPAASRDNNTNAIDTAVKILFIVSPFPIFTYKSNMLFVLIC